MKGRRCPRCERVLNPRVFIWAKDPARAHLHAARVRCLDCLVGTGSVSHAVRDRLMREWALEDHQRVQDNQAGAAFAALFSRASSAVDLLTDPQLILYAVEELAARIATGDTRAQFLVQEATTMARRARTSDERSPDVQPPSQASPGRPRASRRL